MPPENRNDGQDGFGDGGPRILLRAPTHATGDKGAVTSLHPRDFERSHSAKTPPSEQDLESSSAYGSGSSPHDDSGSVSPTTSRSASPAGSPARKREEDLAGLAPKHGVRFEADDRDATARNSTEEDENDALKDVRPSSNQRTVQPTTAGILSIRVPELTDIRDAASDYQPPPSEADVTDRGESAFKDQKGEILSPVGSADSNTEVQDSLEDRLDEAMVYRFNRREGFMPRGKLEKLINVRAVERELARITLLVPNSRTTKSWAELICGDPSSIRAICSVKSEADTGASPVRTYRKIFAMLVRMDKVNSIFKFIEEEVSDKELPLMQYIPPEKTQGNSIQLHRKNDATRPLKCFDGWKDKSVRDFFRDQWEMVSPFFAQGEHCNVRHYQLADADILPFIYDSHDEQGSNGQGLLERGGFGEVFKVQIHPDHHKFEGKHGFGNHKDRFFAVKKLFSTNEAEWKSEIEILKKFGANPNIHLISLLATYEQSGHVHLFFPWADADLHTFWKSIKSTPTPGLKTARWVARQCLGIASGIVAIHKHLSTKTQSSGTGEGNSAEEVKKDNLYGRHGDIKPRNILWFEDGPDEENMGTLVITDFGIAELNSKNSRSNKPNRYIKFSPTYCAPEAHVPGGEICRSYDVWTLGCLYLEFVTWLLGGWKLVLEFARVRQTPEKGSPREEAKLDRFFELEIGDGNKVIGAKVKLEVTGFIKRLRSHPGCTPFIRDFLTLIENELLIVETSTTSRITSIQLHAVLFRMVGKMRFDESYGTNPVPEGIWEPGVPDKTEQEHMPETTAENPAPEATWDNRVLEATWNNPAPEATGDDHGNYHEPNAGDGTNDQNQAAISPPAVRSTPNPDNRVTV